MEINKGKKIRLATKRNAKGSSLGIKKKMIPNKNLDLQKEEYWELYIYEHKRCFPSFLISLTR